MALLTSSQVTDALATLPGWARHENRLEKEFQFPDFPDAVAFLVRVAFDAEAADHHPDVSIHYRRLTLSYWTHSEGGLTEKDVAGARAAENAYRTAAGRG